MKKGSFKAYFALALVSFFWGTTFMASKISTGSLPGLFVSGLRQFSSGIILVSFFLLRGFKLPSAADMRKISLQGILLLCVANGLLTWALEYISSGLAAIISALVPLFVTLFTILLSRCAKVTRLMIGGMVLGFAGIFTIFNNYLGEIHNANFLFGVVLSLCSVLVWAFGTVYTAKQKLSVDILFNVGLQMFIAGTVMLMVCLISGRYSDLASTGYQTWYALLYLVVFGSLVAYSAYVFALSKLPASLVSIYAYINPIVAVAMGWMLLQEKLTSQMILGVLITLGGIFVVNREFRKQRA